MIALRPRYVPAFARTRVQVGAFCFWEDTNCKGDRPVGAITSRGYLMLAGAPLVGAGGGALLGIPWIGLIAGLIAGAVTVLPRDSDFPFSFRTAYCCREGKWTEEGK